MNKTLPLCLLAVSLMLVVVSPVMFSARGARAQEDGIIVDGADYESIITNEHSAELADATAEVATRMIAEYEDFGSILELKASIELDEAASAVSSRAAVEYADFTSNYATQKSDALQQAATAVTSRIVVEYADYVVSLATSPYLGPQQYSDDTTLPNITVTREPSGSEVHYSQDVLVSAYVTDAESGVRNATLQYTTDNSTNWYGANAHEVPMSLNLAAQPQNSSALSFNATIPKQADGTWVRFRIVAYDFAMNIGETDGLIVVVPETLSFPIVVLCMIMTLLLVIVYRKKRIGTF